VEEALAAQGLTPPRLKLLTRYNLLLDKVALKDFSPGMFVNVSTILIRPNTEQASDVAAAIKKADEAYERLEKGEAWAAVLKSVASDPRMSQNDGSIGWRSLMAFPATVSEELKKLPVGKYTKPAQTPFGIQIFRIDAKGESLKGEELEGLKAQYLQGQRQAIVNRLQTEAKIERFLGK
jgi:peptidyl-prolyl cis-trans isomerase SurA